MTGNVKFKRVHGTFSKGPFGDMIILIENFNSFNLNIFDSGNVYNSLPKAKSNIIKSHLQVQGLSESRTVLA